MLPFNPSMANYSYIEKMPLEIFIRISNHLTLKEVLLLTICNKVLKEITFQSLQIKPRKIQLVRSLVFARLIKIALVMIETLKIDKGLICKNLLQDFLEKPSIQKFLLIGLFYETDLAKELAVKFSQICQIRLEFPLEMEATSRYNWLYTISPTYVENLKNFLCFCASQFISFKTACFVYDAHLLLFKHDLSDHLQIDGNILSPLTSYNNYRLANYLENRLFPEPVKGRETELQALLNQNKFLWIFELMTNPALEGVLQLSSINMNGTYLQINQNSLHTQIISETLFTAFELEESITHRYFHLKKTLGSDDVSILKQALQSLIDLSLEKNKGLTAYQIAKVLFKIFLTPSTAVHTKEKKILIRHFMQKHVEVEIWKPLLTDLEDLGEELIVAAFYWNIQHEPEKNFFKGMAAIKHLSFDKRYLYYQESIKQLLKLKQEGEKAFLDKASAKQELEICLNHLALNWPKHLPKCLEILLAAEELYDFIVGYPYRGHYINKATEDIQAQAQIEEPLKLEDLQEDLITDLDKYLDSASNFDYDFNSEENFSEEETSSMGSEESFT